MDRIRHIAFEDNFDPDQKDLLYGVSQGGVRWRDNYISRLYPGLEAMSEQYFWAIDAFNNNLGLFSPQNHFDDMDRSVRRQGRGIDQRQSPIDNYQANYYGSIMASKYSPRGVFRDNREVNKKLEREGYKALAEEDPDNFPDNVVISNARQYLMVRMACKFGIVHFVEMSKNKVFGFEPVIHFALDGLNMLDVINKVKVTGHMGRSAVPITYSELRSCYRNWDSLREHVWFYREYISCAAPWEETQNDWQIYAEVRANKANRLITRARNAIVRYRRFRIVHWNKSAETDAVIKQIEQILATHAHDYRLLKDACRWYLGFSELPPQHEEMVFAIQLKADSRFRVILEEEYMKWCDGR